jgi:predicted HTH domain antitoxin
MTKTMSIRIDKESYDFITELSREEKGDLSKAVRELVYRGRVLLAVEKYRKREASLGKTAEIAGLPIGRMVTLLADYGVESNLEKEDYLEGLKNLRKVW